MSRGAFASCVFLKDKGFNQDASSNLPGPVRMVQALRLLQTHTATEILSQWYEGRAKNTSTPGHCRVCVCAWF